MVDRLKIVNVVISARFVNHERHDLVRRLNQHGEVLRVMGQDVVFRFPDGCCRFLVRTRCGLAVCHSRDMRGMSEIRRLLEVLGVEVVGHPEVVNIVAIGDLGRRVELEMLPLRLPGRVFKPRGFSGLVWRTPIRSVTALLFGSGRFVLAGARNVEELRTAHELVRRVV